jgi:predicted acetyltransferase
VTDEAPGRTVSDGVRFSAVPDEPGEPRGRTRAELFVGDRPVSRLTVIPFTVRVGSAIVPMDGIGGVATDPARRNRGYARRVIEATVERLGRGEAALTMLYSGVSDFYEKFGYATAGAGHEIHLTRLWAETPLPAGWTIRAFEPDDLAAVQRLYEQGTQDAIGAAVRPADAPAWRRLLSDHEGDGRGDCRVVLDPGGRVRAYAWRGQSLGYARYLQRQDGDAFVVSEVMADGPVPADAILAACRLWAREPSAARGDPYRHVLLAHPPDGAVAAAAALGDARLVRLTARSGASMARVLDVERLLTALSAELRRRLERAAPPAGGWPGSLRFVTDIGEGTLRLGGAGAARRVDLPQGTLARLVLGAYDGADQLDRVEAADDGARGVLEVLFPRRHPHMYVPDRY